MKMILRQSRNMIHWLFHYLDVKTVENADVNNIENRKKKYMKYAICSKYVDRSNKDLTIKLTTQLDIYKVIYTCL